MSTRMDTGRLRTGATPLNLSSSLYSTTSPPTLLYDLPQASTITPTPRSPRPSPRSPPPRSRSRGPRSPTTPPLGATLSHPRPVYVGRDTPGSPPRTTKHTPPPSRPLSASGSHELEAFAAHCRAWYFQQDATAGSLMDSILQKIPSSQRAQYSRLQAQIRSSYHTALALRRVSEFHAHLSSTRPGQSLTPTARADPHSKLAKHERLERLSKFISVWAVSSVPGTKPFFDGLFAVLRLQSLPEYLGGAGSFRMEWEIDDAVFRESAGKEFMLEAVGVLKGVLGFEESPTPQSTTQLGLKGSPQQMRIARLHRPTLSTMNSTMPLDATGTETNALGLSANGNRKRAPSDPFADVHSHRSSLRANTATVEAASPSLMPLIPGSPSQSGGRVGNHSPLPPEDYELETGITPGWVTRTVVEDDEEFEAALLEPPRNNAVSPRHKTQVPSATSRMDGTEPEPRTWMAPDLSNTEIMALLRLFPPNITRGAVPRFPMKKMEPPDGEADLEAGIGMEGDEREYVRFGTGRMCVSGMERGGGWRGTAWDRFVEWWKRVFC